MKKADSNLAKNTLEDIPTPKKNACDIVAVTKSGGSISGYKLSNDTTVTKEAGVEMAREGLIKGVGVAKRYDTEYLKSIPDDSESNNLSDLPTVDQ